MTHFQTVNPFFIGALILPPNFLIRVLQFIAGLRWLEMGQERFSILRAGGLGQQGRALASIPSEVGWGFPLGSPGPHLRRPPCCLVPPCLDTHVGVPPSCSVLWRHYSQTAGKTGEGHRRAGCLWSAALRPDHS